MRRKARELALQTLFQLDFTPKTSSSELLALIGESFDSGSFDYSSQLVNGVRAQLEKVDALIQASSPRWKLDRMASVDRNLLRLAAFEIFFATERIKPSIAINEAIEVAKVYGTAESSAFIHGILDQMVKDQGLNS